MRALPLLCLEKSPPERGNKEEERRTGMAEEKFDFLQEHSLRFLEMAFRTDRRERLDTCDGYGRRTGQCGDTVEMFLCMEKGVVRSVSYDTDGCLSTNACANAVAELTEGRALEEAWGITPEEVASYLETLPRESLHCADLAVGALYLALTEIGRKAVKVSVQRRVP